MLTSRPTQRLCKTCSHQLLSLFANGFASPTRLSRYGGESLLQNASARRFPPLSRSFATRGILRAVVQHDELQNEDGIGSPAEMEAIVRQARQTFGETLPENFLSGKEYQIYERLYGAPLATTLPEDVDLLQGLEGEDADIDETRPNVLMREDKDGNLEEIIFEEHPDEESEEELEDVAEETAAELLEEFKGRGETQDATASTDPESELRFQARLNNLHQKYAAIKRETATTEAKEEAPNHVEITQVLEESQPVEEEEEVEEDLESEGNEYDRSDTVRAHPLSSAGHFGTSPSTIQLPKDTFVDPITALLADASNKHLSEVALKTFGGAGLPNSTATFKRADLVQQTIALEASQSRMGEMEANAYLAAIYPGAFASIMCTLVEIRKRLGTEWLRNLMQKREGPRILDAGSGGAAVLAWREVIQAEYEAMHPSEAPQTTRPPFGRSTVVTGAPSLRLRASALLDDTTFIPRLPDYDPTRDHPSLESSNPQPRKQYDIIIAPYTLWSLKEDHMRKAQIQNFYSLLDPRGGVLILLEKGVPRGFELIASARETILKHHIASPPLFSTDSTFENPLDPVSENRFSSKEPGMIIAPCTSHGKCPMYIAAGKSQGRKDFCHFNQRFIRPPHLQRILGNKDRNHEDIQFSYVAFQRGRDLRQEQNFSQGEAAAVKAFEGFEDAPPADSTTHENAPPHVLSLPRAILPPIKRRGHVILDLCTPGGKIERWTVPKSFSKQAYRDARKSKWGDLWALGAKTRVGRNIRVGRKEKGRKEGRQERVVDDEGGEEDEEEEENDDNDALMDERRGGGVKKKGKGRGKKADARGEKKGRSGRAKYPKNSLLEHEEGQV